MNLITPIAPSRSILDTLLWVVELAQARATENDFNSVQEELAEHDALRAVTDWLEAQGMDVAIIRAAEMAPEIRAVLEAAIG